MKALNIKRILFGCLYASLVLQHSGCAVWVERPAPPEVSAVEQPSEEFSTITIVRKKQFALSAVLFTVSVDGAPVVNLKPGEYTQYRVLPGEHRVSIQWDIGGLNVLGGGPGGGGYITDPVRRYNKKIRIECLSQASCFVIIDAKAFAGQEEERVMLQQVEQLQGDFTTEGKLFISPREVKHE